jgi:membrane protease YdiL (CAAX protease family)
MAAPDKLGLALRIGLFAFLEILALSLFFPLLSWTGTLIAAAFTPFIAASLTNAFTLRIFERRRLGDIGLQWTGASRRNLVCGIAAGVGTGLLVMLPPLAIGWAKLEPAAEKPAHFLPSLLFVTAVIFIGAIGEEILFRGYGFQILARAVGPFATLLPVAVLFAAGHSGNLGVNNLGLANTFLWGAVLGWCVFRSGDLWLASGLHFGWNWTLPLFGEELSGFKMGVTGYQTVWSAPELWSGGAYGPEGSLLTTLALPLLVLALWKAPVQTQRLPLIQDAEEAAHERPTESQPNG